MKNAKLITMLEIYFEETNFSRSNLLTRDKVMKLLKDELSKLGYWKSGRGKDKKLRKVKPSSLSNLKSSKQSTSSFNEVDF